MCTKSFDTVTTYFLSDESTQVGIPSSISDVSSETKDDCCTASGGTDSGLVGACFSTEIEANVVYSWDNNMCTKSFDATTTYFLSDEAT